MSVTVPFDIVNGQAGDATKVQANFEAIEAQAASIAYVDSVSGGGVPTGAITMWGAALAPTGWLLCDGSSISRTTYSDLFAVLSTTYGSGGASVFNVPNLKGRFPVGRDSSDAAHDALGETGGSQDAIVVAHSHTSPAHTHTGPSHTHGFTTDSDGLHDHTTGIADGFDVNSANQAGATNAIFTAGSVPLDFTTRATAALAADVGGTNIATSIAAVHTHTGTTNAGGTAATGSTAATVASAGVTGVDKNLPPFLTLNFIIKT